MTKVVVVGSGYWGKNLVRNFNAPGALTAGWNVLAGSDTESIMAAHERLGGSSPGSRPTLYGDGRASLKVVRYLIEGL